MSALNAVPSSTATASGSVIEAGCVPSFQRPHGQSPTTGSGRATVKDHVRGELIALPAASLAVTVAR